MKFLVVGSKNDPASRNMVLSMIDLGGFEISSIEGDMLYEKNLDLEKISKYDLIIFASKHKSEKKEKTLSIHAPGNLKEVWGGGKEGKLCPSSALFQKHLYEIINKKMKEFDLGKYKLTMEATHHGPLINKPCVFVEIGGGAVEWKDRRASFVLIRALKEAIDTFKPNQYREVAVGIGGPHYCPGFNKLQLHSNVAISHVIPKYVRPITKEMIIESIEKTHEEVDFVVLDWKGLGKAEEREKVVKILEENYISYKKISEIKK